MSARKPVIQRTIETRILDIKREIVRDLSILTTERVGSAGEIAKMVERRAEKMRGMSDALIFLVRDGYLHTGMSTTQLQDAMRHARTFMTAAACTPLPDYTAVPYAEGAGVVYEEIARAVERKLHPSRRTPVRQ